jgi:PAS domain S-box-containing protein
MTVSSSTRFPLAEIDAALARAPHGVYCVDEQFRLVYINDVAWGIFGHIAGLPGRDFAEVLHLLWPPAYADEIAAIFRRTLETGEPYRSEERVETRVDLLAPESYDWELVRVGSPATGRSVVCYFRNVSQEVRARRQIAASEQRYRTLVLATSDVVFRMSADWSEMTQLEGRQVMVDTVAPSREWVTTYLPASERPHVLAALTAARDARRPVEIEHGVYRRDGSLGWVTTRVVPLLDDEGVVVEWFGTARDVTDRRDADAQVARLTAQADQERRLYHTVLSNTPDLVYVFDLDHRFAYANPALLQLWGRTWDDAVGKTCLELGYEPWHAQMHDREIDQVISTARPIRGEVPFNGTNGRRMYDYIFVPVIGADGTVEAVAGTTRDVTERRAAEDAAHQSEQRLADANRAKDLFLATLSHELRTPLNAVLGWAHMLRTGSLRPELRLRALESIERNAHAQAQLVDDLLDMSRIMSGKLAIKATPIDLASVVLGAADAVRPGAEAKSLVLVVRYDPAVRVIVAGDPDRLQQVVWNLLSNAVKFTPAGGRIDAALGTDGADAVITVVDSGEGIAPAFMPYLFERFTQADATASRRHGGLGLGLAIVRHLVEAHGGTVSGHSDGPGTGTRFEVRLPCHAVEAGWRVRRDVNGSPAARLADTAILLIDDDPEARALTRAILEASGARVQAVASAGEGLHELEHLRVDAIVADIGMPEHDGYALIRAVRSLPADRGGLTPALAVTAYAGDAERDAALLAGYDAHLSTPIEPAQVVSAVARLLGRGGND